MSAIQYSVLEKPNCGWCHFHLENFQGTCSYITDVPGNVLDAILYYLDHRTASVNMDEEGSKFTVVINEYKTIIIAERADTEIHTIEIDATDLIQRMLYDIKTNLIDFAEFNLDEECGYLITEEKTRLTQKIQLIYDHPCAKHLHLADMPDFQTK